jgi:hypothetical protein
MVVGRISDYFFKLLIAAITLLREANGQPKQSFELRARVVTLPRR